MLTRQERIDKKISRQFVLVRMDDMTFRKVEIEFPWDYGVEERLELAEQKLTASNIPFAHIKLML